MSSVLQLGVGIHAGTALLQIYSEFLMSPFQKRLDILHSIGNELVRTDELGKSRKEEVRDFLDRVSVLRSKFDFARRDAFNAYKDLVGLNFIVAALLYVALCLAAFNADVELPAIFAVLFCGGSILPAVISLYRLYKRVSKNLSLLKATLGDLEIEAQRV